MDKPKKKKAKKAKAMVEEHPSTFGLTKKKRSFDDFATTLAHFMPSSSPPPPPVAFVAVPSFTVPSVAVATSAVATSKKVKANDAIAATTKNGRFKSRGVSSRTATPQAAAALGPLDLARARQRAAVRPTRRGMEASAAPAYKMQSAILEVVVGTAPPTSRSLGVRIGHGGGSPSNSNNQEQPKSVTPAIALAQRQRQHKEHKGRMKELKQQERQALATALGFTPDLFYESAASATSDLTDPFKIIQWQELTRTQKSSLNLFLNCYGWTLVKFVPNEWLYINAPTLLPQLFKYCGIASHAQQKMYTDQVKKVFKDLVNQKRNYVKNLVHKKYLGRWIQNLFKDSCWVVSFASRILLTNTLPFHFTLCHRILARQ